MFFDDDAPKKPAPVFTPAKLELLSVAQMQEYIDDLQGEIGRVEQEIERRGQHKHAAQSLFKS